MRGIKLMLDNENVTLNESGFLQGINYTPHDKQKLFHDSKKTFRAFIGGVGSGKTIAGIVDVIKFAWKYPGAFIIVVAPTYPMLRDTTRLAFFEMCPDYLIKEKLKGENKVLLINGSEVWFRSADEPDKLRGPTIAAFYIDEAALVSGLTWKIMLGRIRQKGYPHRGWLTTTPKGFNWIYDRFIERKNKNYELFQVSSYDNPHLTEDYIQNLEEDYSGVFKKQEILGQFVGFEGVVYSSFSRNIHVIKEEVREIAIKSFKKVICGVDWGFRNPATLLVIGLDGDGKIYLIDEFSQSGIGIEAHVQAAKEFKEKYKIEIFYPDPSNAENVNTFRNAGLNCGDVINDVLPGIQLVENFIFHEEDTTPQLYIFDRCVNTIMEFENYRYPISKEGKPLQENPLKVHDHLMDALRYALVGDKNLDRYGMLEGGEDLIF